MTQQNLKTDVVERSIENIYLSAFSPRDIKQTGVIEIVNSQYYTNDSKRLPAFNGPLDPKMGPGNVKYFCDTCKLPLISCPGHFGYIKLRLPCFHPGYINKIVEVLQCICKKCSHILLPEDQKKMRYRSLITKLNSDSEFRKSVKRISAICKKSPICFNCGHTSGTVKKINSIKVIYISSKSSSKCIQSKIDKYSLSPHHILDLLNRIPLKDLILLGFKKNSHPRNGLILTLPAPPPVIRPSTFDEARGGSTEDDLTIKLGDMVMRSIQTEYDLAQGTSIKNTYMSWDTLQAIVATYLSSDAKIPSTYLAGMKDRIRSLSVRLKGKTGRFRGNLSGKRVDFTGRTVISPDPNIPINYVVIPLHMAKILTFPETVTNINMEKMRKIIRNGIDIHPGANYVISKKTGIKKWLKFSQRETVANELDVGDVVERHLAHGDVVLFNRQPSLHRMSIMCHYVKIFPTKTLRLNECVCFPYNADFDGDEMNIHVPQNYQARSEAIHLMGVSKNVTTPRNGDLLIASTQDFITGTYMLSSKDTFLTFDQYNHLTASYHCDEDVDDMIFVDTPAILKPFQLWTGKQAISRVIKPHPTCKANVNIRCKGRNYSSDKEELTEDDTFVVIYNSVHIAGYLDKNIIGSGSKKGLYYAIFREYGSEECGKIMLRFNRISIAFLLSHGFSIGIKDVWASATLNKKIRNAIDQGYFNCDKLIQDYKSNKLPLHPGCSPEETLEVVLMNELSETRNTSGKICVKELKKDESLLIMAQCGSKGSLINVSQMIACVGQQAINGHRTPEGFEGRSLPHFEKSSKAPSAKGFVSNSFFTGLTPTEFFFHAMAGREGLVDTAVKTANTGYMQRRLVKCLEDLCVQYDNTVRNSDRHIVQFKYGEDGLDPLEMEGIDTLIDTDSLFYHTYSLYYNPSDPQLNSSQITNSYLQYKEEYLKTFHDSYIRLIDTYIEKMVINRSNYESAIDSPLNKEIKIIRITQKVLFEFIKSCQKKYRRAVIEPGTTVGPICAQSIGEPATQMTLKTFHFAGVASMNITQGVPRMQEIINASANISTPVISAPLKMESDQASAICVKNKIDRVSLKEICSSITISHSKNGSLLHINLDSDKIQKNGMDIDAYSIYKRIVEDRSIKLTKNFITPITTDKLQINPRLVKKQILDDSEVALKTHLADYFVTGSKDTRRVVLQSDSTSNGLKYNLLVEGNDLLSVISTRIIDSNHVTSNSLIQVQNVLGIEAARNMIIREISSNIKNHGINVDIRHYFLLADLMTHTGEVLGITRFGLSKLKQNPIMLASFEQTCEHLYNAAFFGTNNPINGVSEQIIFGTPISVGTGMIKILDDNTATTSPH